MDQHETEKVVSARVKKNAQEVRQQAEHESALLAARRDFEKAFNTWRLGRPEAAEFFKLLKADAQPSQYAVAATLAGFSLNDQIGYQTIRRSALRLVDDAKEYEKAVADFDKFDRQLQDIEKKLARASTDEDREPLETKLYEVQELRRSALHRKVKAEFAHARVRDAKKLG